ncbi:MAG: adenylate/guanylate cyclase domain-containing protein [Bacteroidota bacterium]
MQESERRLTTVMFTDIYGYSKLMNNNEQMAFRLLEAHNRITSGIIQNWNGLIIKRIGDALLVEFRSTLDAWNAATKIHDRLKEFNENRETGQRLILRIGIHIGDVVVKENDLLGDGVNIAARLQQIAVPGSTCLSQAAYASIRSQIDRKITRAGNVELKNIADRYTVYLSESVYPDEFPLPANPGPVKTSTNFTIKNMVRIPPEKLSLMDAIIIAVALIFIFDFITVNIMMNTSGDTMNEVIVYLSQKTWFLLSNLFFLAAITLIIVRDAVRVRFEDVRGVDKALNFLIMKAGFKEPVKKGDELIFKPTMYNFMVWGTQKMRVSIDGNNVFISGSYLFIRRVKKLLQTYQS